MLADTRKQSDYLASLGFERIGPIDLEDRLNAIGYKIDPNRTWHYFDAKEPSTENKPDYKMIYPMDADKVNVAALVELRKKYFCFSNGFIWDVGSY
jgi:hypothetical protein